MKEQIKIREKLIEEIEKDNYSDGQTQKLCRQLIRFGKKWKDDKGIGCGKYYLALNDMRRNRYRKALENIQEALLEAVRLSEENKDTTYKLSMMYLLATLYWRTGRREYSYEHLEEMMEIAGNANCVGDYTQNIVEFVELLKEMQEYEKMNRIIECYEEYAKTQDSVYLYITAAELRLSYCELLGREEEYKQTALRYTKLSQELKKQLIVDRAQVMQMKIILKEKELEHKNAQRREERLKKKSEKDALTGLGNRYLLDKYSRQLLNRAVKEHKSIGIGVLDIDCFKQYNDTYGHLAGDKCLIKIAAIIEEKAQKRGKCFRYGGDEFVILMEDIMEEDIIQLARDMPIYIWKSFAGSTRC